MCVCECVFVCVREREREREVCVKRAVLFLSFKIGNQSFTHTAHINTHTHTHTHSHICRCQPPKPLLLSNVVHKRRTTLRFDDLMFFCTPLQDLLTSTQKVGTLGHKFFEFEFEFELFCQLQRPEMSGKSGSVKGRTSD